jgi:hypothetical protein
LRLAKFGNNKLNKGFTKYYAIKIKILIIYIKILYLLLVYLLFGKIISNALRFFSLKISNKD